MPYPSQRKAETRARIVEAARVLFNHHGYEHVTIDMVMEAASLTRGGFYNHFPDKQALFAAAVGSFLMGRGARWRMEAGVNASAPVIEDAFAMLRTYLSPEHLGDLDGQCPLIALPTDVGRSGPAVQDAYQQLLAAMVWLYERAMPIDPPQRRQRALALAALSVGGMVLARTIPDEAFGEEVRSAALAMAFEMLAQPEEA